MPVTLWYGVPLIGLMMGLISAMRAKERLAWALAALCFAGGWESVTSLMIANHWSIGDTGLVDSVTAAILFGAIAAIDGMSYHQMARQARADNRGLRKRRKELAAQQTLKAHIERARDVDMPIS